MPGPMTLEWIGLTSAKNHTAHAGRATADNSLGYLDEKEKLLENMEQTLPSSFSLFLQSALF